jgi:diguanylate cyclase (GGDEF)-like protein
MTSTNQESQLSKTVAKLEKELIQLNKLFELTKIINSVSDLDSLAVNINSFILENFEPNNIAFFLKEEDIFRVISYENIECPHYFEFKDQGEGIWHIIIQGKPIKLLNEQNEKIYPQFFENYDLDNLNAKLWLPVVYQNTVIAIISLGSKVSNQNYSENEFILMQSIIDFFAPVINKYRKLRDKESTLVYLQKTLHNISILYNIGQAMNFIDDLKRLIQIIIAKAIQTIGAERGSLMLYDSNSDELVVKVVYGLPDKESEKKINDGHMECTRIKIGEGIAGEAFANKKAIITNLGENDPRFFPSDLSKVQSLLCLPLIVKEEAIGVINIANKKDNKFFNQDDLDFMGALANQAAIAISNAQLYELAITDSLTKLFIRRHFEYLLDSEVRRSHRYRHHLSLLMMDIDNFKSINDTYGHQAGDEMLKKIAQVITLTIRKIDMPSRFGGEEFALILPETHKENAKKIAERLRKKIADIILLTRDGIEVKPTISIGIAAYPIDAEDKDSLVGRADEALYFAKRMGKNRVAEYTPKGCLLMISQENQ